MVIFNKRPVDRTGKKGRVLNVSQIILQRGVVQRKLLLFECQIATWRFQSSPLSPLFLHRVHDGGKERMSARLDSMGNWGWQPWDVTCLPSIHFLLLPPSFSPLFILSPACYPFSCHSPSLFFPLVCYLFYFLFYSFGFSVFSPKLKLDTSHRNVNATATLHLGSTTVCQLLFGRLCHQPKRLRAVCRCFVPFLFHVY